LGWGKITELQTKRCIFDGTTKKRTAEKDKKRRNEIARKQKIPANKTTCLSSEMNAGHLEGKKNSKKAVKKKNAKK